MVRYLILLFSASFCLFSQENIRVYTSIHNTPLTNFEKDLVTYLFELYQKTYENRVRVTFEPIDNYHTFFPESPDQNRNAIAIGGISFTKKRAQHFLLSQSYFPVKQALITSKYRNVFVPKNLGYFPNTMHLQTAYRIAKEENYTLFELDTIYSAVALKTYKIDIYLGDLIEVWLSDSLKVFRVLENEPQSNYCLLFPKSSRLQHKLEPILSYALKSRHYHKLIRKHFGHRASDYFKNVR